MPGHNGLRSKAIKPVPSADDQLLWEDRQGKIRREAIGPSLINAPLHTAQRARIKKPYKGQKHRNGRYWFSQIEHSVWHESMLERWALMFLDYAADVVAVSAQPCLLQFADGSYHYPDYFIVYGDGRKSILDVHFTGISRQSTLNKFRRTQDACQRIGWTFEMFRSVDPVVLRNVELLSMYRHPMYAPENEAGESLAHAVHGLPFGLAVEGSGKAAKALTTCRIYHLLWTGDLTADLTKPFGDHTILWSH